MLRYSFQQGEGLGSVVDASRSCSFLFHSASVMNKQCINGGTSLPSTTPPHLAESSQYRGEVFKRIEVSLLELLGLIRPQIDQY